MAADADDRGGQGQRHDPSCEPVDDRGGHDGAGKGDRLPDRQPVAESCARAVGRCRAGSWHRTAAKLRPAGATSRAPSCALRACPAVPQNAGPTAQAARLAWPSDSGCGTQGGRRNVDRGTGAATRVGQALVRAAPREQEQAVRAACARGGVHRERQSENTVRVWCESVGGGHRAGRPGRGHALDAGQPVRRTHAGQCAGAGGDLDRHRTVDRAGRSRIPRRDAEQSGHKADSESHPQAAPGSRATAEKTASRGANDRAHEDGRLSREKPAKRRDRRRAACGDVWRRTSPEDDPEMG